MSSERGGPKKTNTFLFFFQKKRNSPFLCILLLESGNFKVRNGMEKNESKIKINEYIYGILK